MLNIPKSAENQVCWAGEEPEKNYLDLDWTIVSWNVSLCITLGAPFDILNYMDK